ncbi:MAG: RNA-binding protein [Bdellovibrio sp.]
MNSKLYIGNLSYQAKEEELTETFSEFGEVKSVRIITDRETGRPRGFAFVEMGDADQAQAALDGLNGKEVLGRTMKVSFAQEKERTGGGGRGGGGRGPRRED